MSKGKVQDTPHLQPSYTTILHPINILVFSNIRCDWCRMTDDLSIQTHREENTMYYLSRNTPQNSWRKQGTGY